MQSFLVWWQHIPQSLSPVAIHIGAWPVYWYALFFLLGAFLVYWLAGREYARQQVFTKEQYGDFSFGVFLSVLIGGKLGFLFFYWWPFLSLSSQSLWPGQGSGSLALPGMSFVGGLIGAVLFMYWYARKHQKNFFTLTDILAPFIPLAIFFGRLGSFVHTELPGRITQVPWGMYLPGEAVLRHPSTLYAAALEGCLLLYILFFLRKKNAFGTGNLTAYFCIGYGALRFTAEFFREPDAQIGYLGVLTLNQIFAVAILVLGAGILAVKNYKNKV